MSVGAKVSQPGVDVKFAADHQLLFSSQFYSLKIHAQGSTTITAGDPLEVSHNLGYIPAVYAYEGASIFRQLRVDSSKLYFDANPAIDHTFYYYIFRHDLTTTISQENIDTTATSTGASDDFGFVISKSGFDVSTATPKDMVIDSRYRSHIIHKGGTQTVTGSATVTISHNLGYVPMFLAYAKGDNQTEVMNVSYNAIDASTFADSSNLTINFDPTSSFGYWTTSWDVYFIIFKDPILL